MVIEIILCILMCASSNIVFWILVAKPPTYYIQGSKQILGWKTSSNDTIPIYQLKAKPIQYFKFLFFSLLVFSPLINDIPKNQLVWEKFQMEPIIFSIIVTFILGPLSLFNYGILMRKILFIIFAILYILIQHQQLVTIIFLQSTKISLISSEPSESLMHLLLFIIVLLHLSILCYGIIYIVGIQILELMAYQQNVTINTSFLQENQHDQRDLIPYEKNNNDTFNDKKDNELLENRYYLKSKYSLISFILILGISIVLLITVFFTFLNGSLHQGNLSHSHIHVQGTNIKISFTPFEVKMLYLGQTISSPWIFCFGLLHFIKQIEAFIFLGINKLNKSMLLIFCAVVLASCRLTIEYI